MSKAISLILRALSTAAVVVVLRYIVYLQILSLWPYGSEATSWELFWLLLLVLLAIDTFLVKSLLMGSGPTKSGLFWFLGIGLLLDKVNLLAALLFQGTFILFTDYQSTLELAFAPHHWIGTAALVMGGLAAYILSAKPLAWTYRYWGILIFVVLAVFGAFYFNHYYYSGINIEFKDEIQGLNAVGLISDADNQVLQNEKESTNFAVDPTGRSTVIAVSKAMGSKEKLERLDAVIFDSGHKRVVLGLPGETVRVVKGSGKVTILKDSQIFQSYDLQISAISSDSPDAIKNFQLEKILRSDEYLFIPLNTVVSQTVLAPPIALWDRGDEIDVEKLARVKKKINKVKIIFN